MFARRARGMLLRLARRRLMSTIAGLVLLLPAAWLEFSGCCGAAWIDGLALVLGATGAAFLWTALTGIRPDWIDETDDPRPRN
jgi:hypothetical protein